MPNPHTRGDEQHGTTGTRPKAAIRRTTSEGIRHACLTLGISMRPPQVRLLMAELMETYGDPSEAAIAHAVADWVRIGNRTDRSNADYIAALAEQNPGPRRAPRRRQWRLGEGPWRTHA